MGGRSQLAALEADQLKLGGVVVGAEGFQQQILGVDWQGRAAVVVRVELTTAGRKGLDFDSSKTPHRK